MTETNVSKHNNNDVKNFAFQLEGETLAGLRRIAEKAHNSMTGTIRVAIDRLIADEDEVTIAKQAAATDHPTTEVF